MQTKLSRKTCLFLAIIFATGLLSLVSGESRKGLSHRSLLATHSQNAVAHPGINLAGAEFGGNYKFPTHQEIDYFNRNGINTFRFPVTWERLQPSLGGDLDYNYVRQLQDVCEYALTKLDGVCIIDVHNSGRYNNQPIGQNGGPSIQQFQNLWTRLASYAPFKSRHSVWFSLMNEPYGFTTAFVRQFMQAGINAVRQTGANNMVIVNGNGYSGTYSWVTEASFFNYGQPNAQVFGGLTDGGLNRIIIDTHNYFDYYNEGNGNEPQSATVGRDRLVGFVSWCRQNKYLCMIGETGAGQSSLYLQAWDNQMDYIYANRDVIISWCWWAAGPIWNQDYWSLLEPYPSGADKPQMAHVYKYT